jgi:hypothetical protein
MWHDAYKTNYDLFTNTLQPITIGGQRLVTPATFFLPFSGEGSNEKVRLMGELLNDPNSLGVLAGTNLVLPSVARGHPSFVYCAWMGNTWVNLNFIAYSALKSYGEDGQASLVRTNTLAMVEKFNNTMESYNNGDYSSYGSTCFTQPFYVWSASLYNVMLNDKFFNNSETVCIPSWQCGAWSTCVGGLTSRVCTDVNGCGVSTGKPVESQSCSCTPTTFLGAWGACVGDVQSRTNTSQSVGCVNTTVSTQRACVSSISAELQNFRQKSINLIGLLNKISLWRLTR